MNSIRKIRELNERELKSGVSTDASWHADYRDTAYVYIGGLPHELSEGDVVTIFSQYGEVSYINLIRDKETGKSRGFAFLKYEDQRSTDLAVDNLGGAVVLGRMLNVDHTRYQKRNENDESHDLSLANMNTRTGDSDEMETGSQYESSGEQPALKEERELAKLMRELDDEDPMKQYFIQEKKDEIALALSRRKDGKHTGKSHRHRSQHGKSRRRPRSDSRIAKHDRH